VKKLFINIIYYFYLFSVFWLTRVIIILFAYYTVIVKCIYLFIYFFYSFIEYIILLLKLFVNVL